MLFEKILHLPLPGGDEVKLCQYADDITGFLADLSSINILFKYC